MALAAERVRRYGRQIALSSVGPEGQERICAATAVIVGEGIAASTAASYLVGAGVGRMRTIVPDADWPQDGPAWMVALDGASVVVRAGFEDDAMLRAAVRLGIPVVALRARLDQVDVLAFRQHGPCPHADLEVPAREGEPDCQGATAVLAGTLAASEALWLLIAPGQPPRARHLRLSLTGAEPSTQEIPWAPECFLCGGQARVAVPA